MLLSIALILVLGMFLGWICGLIKLPRLVGMLLTGVLLGPYVFHILDPQLLAISADLRKIALIIILTRAGLSLDLSGLKKIGRPALLMCFLPATCELIGVTIFGTLLLHLQPIESALLGAVLAAVSPAVVVPRMVKLMEEEYGTGQGIPQLILAGASVDDVYVIVLFTTITGMMTGGHVDVMRFVNIPVSIILGIAIGLGAGYLFAKFFERVHMRDTGKVLCILSASFLLVAAEDALTTTITFSALIAIMFIGIGLKRYREVVAQRVAVKYNKLWVGAEVFLFVLVGATVDIRYLASVGGLALIAIIGGLIFRMAGVLLCVAGTHLNRKERIFTMMAYTPKATVQAAIAGVPLSLGLACGNTILTVAVLAIVFTAPIGAWAIDSSYRKLLTRDRT